MGVLEASYYELEQKHTKVDLIKKIKTTKYLTLDNDIIVEFDAKQLNQNSFNMLMQLSDIITESGEIGMFELDIFKISINSITTYEHNLINLK
jgi:hypothetical protein